MVRNLFILIFPILILNCVLADVIVVTDEIVPFLVWLLPSVILIETLAFSILIYDKKIKKIKIQKILLVILIANIFSSLIGLLLGVMQTSIPEDLVELSSLIFGLFHPYYIIFSLIVSIVSEFLIIYLFFKNYFNLKKLLFSCTLANILSYIFIFEYVAFSYEISLQIAARRHRENLNTFFERVELLGIGCAKLKSLGCEKVNVSDVVMDIDVNKDGFINENDTLFEVCKKFYNIRSEIECKKLCHCSVSIR